jgi:pyridoxal 5'-phosphate synthase pdxS subunit
MIRSKGEAGTGDVSNATTHMRQIRGEINRLRSMTPDELYVAAKELQAPYDLVVRSRRPASCRSCSSPRAASPPRPTRP